MKKFYKKLFKLMKKDEELLKKGRSIFFYEEEYEIWCNDFTFVNEEIWYECRCVAQNRTPKQCHEFMRAMTI